MQPHTKSAQQYFPHYKIDEEGHEIGLREYDLAAKALESDQRSLTVAAGVALFFSGTVTTFIGSGATSFRNISETLGKNVEPTLLIAVTVIAFLAVHYFAQLQRSAVYAARKIVVLRRLLGIDYGNIESVLPGDKLDGANEPFSISMFPGWASLAAIPTVVIALVAAFTTFSIETALAELAPQKLTLTSDIPFVRDSAGVKLGFGVALVLCVFYRVSLKDDFESARLLIAIRLGGIFRLRVKSRVGHVLYRLRLSVYEAERLGYRLELFFPLLVCIEDRRYHKHNGNSTRDAGRALFNRMRDRGSKGGGSTIYQQLARSNFLSAMDPLVSRKILEWLLAPWLNQQFRKEEGLKAYLCSVRYARGVLGLPAADKHFFPTRQHSDDFSPAERFLLVERLSSVSNSYRLERVQRLLSIAVNAASLSEYDREDVLALYDKLCAEGILRSTLP